MYVYNLLRFHSANLLRVCLSIEVICIMTRVYIIVLLLFVCVFQIMCIILACIALVNLINRLVDRTTGENRPLADYIEAGCYFYIYVSRQHRHQTLPAVM